MILHLIIRIFFVIHYSGSIPVHSVKEGLNIFIWGFQIDLSAIIWLNAPIVLLFFIANLFPGIRTVLQQVCRILFVALNLIGLALNIADIGYFEFSRHRSNADLWYVIPGSLGFMGSIIRTYWPLILLLIMFCIALIKSSKKNLSFRSKDAPILNVLVNDLIMMAILVILARGWQNRPLIPSTPLLNLNAEQLPLAQNSIQTFYYSIINKQEQVQSRSYFSQSELNQLAKSTRELIPSSASGMNKKNVVICILESFSRCFLTPGDPHKAITPFFDSLIRKSVYFPNAYANGFTSNQSVVSIFGGLPAFLDEPLYYSIYANTPLNGIGNILKENGYNTYFFLGAGKDHFGFGKFCHLAGIDHYYGRHEFNDDRFYDGNWGIFDEPFLQFSSKILEKQDQPFMAVLYNISSHPPFKIPDAFIQQFNTHGQSTQQQSITYVDYSFRKFFESIQKSSWFKNSIFVFCADHYLYPDDGTPVNFVSVSSIPIFFYLPDRDSGSVNDSLISQVDLTPSILSLLNYHGNYGGLGQNIFDSTITEHIAVNKPGHIYQIIEKDFALGFDASRNESISLYHIANDPLCQSNLIDHPAYVNEKSKLERLLKANLQCYSQALLRRSLR